MQRVLRTVAVPAVVTTTLLVLLAPGTTVASSGGASTGRDGDTGMKLKFTEKVVGLTVVSVSMLTEGWDANTVTHILGVRAFRSERLRYPVPVHLVGQADRRPQALAADAGGRGDPGA